MRSQPCVLLSWALLSLLVPHMMSLRIIMAAGAQQVQGSSCSNPDTAAADDRSPAAKARSYDKIIGVQQYGARYQFSSEQHYVLEAAQRLLDAGFTSFKFRLWPESSDGSIANLLGSNGAASATMKDLVTSKDLPFGKVLEMPFTSFHLILGGIGSERDLSDEEVDWYQQVYDLSVHLIERFKGKGKTFYLEGWKGDFQVRSWKDVDPASHIPTPTAFTPVQDDRVELFGKLWWEQQAAVDDAKGDLADSMQGVQVFSSVEVNLFRNDTVDWTVIDDIIPSIDPGPDYVTIALTSVPQNVDSLKPAEKLYELLDYVNSKLSAKEGVPGPRVMIGEFGFPLRRSDGVADELTGSQEQQAQHALAVAAACIAWGAGSAQYHSLYDSTTTAANTAPKYVRSAAAAAAAGVYQDQGFALVSKEGKDTVLYTALKAYLSQAEEWLVNQMEAAGGDLPCADDFRTWAVAKLVQSAGELGPEPDIAAPPIKNKQGCQRAQKTVVV